MKFGQDIISDNRIFPVILIGTGVLLLIPFIAQWPWTASDYIVMGTLVFGFGSLFVLLARRIDKKYRLIVGGFLLLTFLWLWAELAVGVFTNWGS